MADYKYRFSVFTPCYNSTRFIHRVFKTLDSQTYRNFEWIVINDASTDNTGELIAEYIKKVDFKVKFYDLKKNQMLAANCNLAASVAEGEFLYALAHDDEHVSTALEEFDNLISKYNSDNIAEVVSRTQTQYGDITTKEFAKPVMNYFDYAYINGNYVGEMNFCIKLSVFKKYVPYDVSISKNTALPISGLLACEGYKNICTNSIVRIYYIYENETSLTKLLRHDWYGLWYQQTFEINKFQYFRTETIKSKLRIRLMYDYYSKEAKIGFRKTFKSLEKKRDKILCFIYYPMVLVIILLLKNSQIKKLLLQFMKK